MSDLVTCITVSPVNHEAYEPYGQVVYSPTPSSGGKAQVVNQGTARRYNHVVELENFRSEPNACSGSIPAVPNMCIFQCDPQWQPGSLFHVRLLERHQHSTQCFMPIARPLATNVGGDYLVIVALNGADDRPDVATLRAFIGRPWQGITYRPGIWHHPMVALTQEMHFLCLVWENGQPQEDCETVNIQPGFQVRISLSDLQGVRSSGITGIDDN